MKNLSDFILEKCSGEKCESKTFTFNFDGIDEIDDTLKTIEADKYCEVSDKQVTVKVTKDNANKLSNVYDLLSNAITGLRSSQKRASDEQFAQKTAKLEKNVKALNNYINELSNPTETPAEELKKETKKDEKKEEE